MGHDVLQVFIGWDSREPIAYDVCRFSLERHASVPVEVVPLKQQELREAGLYSRKADPLASTEFTYTRFLTPHLARKPGWAVFCDCDFLWRADIAELFAIVEPHPEKAVFCVQHDYRPSETVKMDNKTQTRYPRKNWSSLMVFNTAHPALGALSPETVSAESGAYLHRMRWAQDSEIGVLPEIWNWLEGWSNLHSNAEPKAIHYTRGGPWFENWQHVAYADLWIAERDRLLAGRTSPQESSERVL